MQQGSEVVVFGGDVDNYIVDSWLKRVGPVNRDCGVLVTWSGNHIDRSRAGIDIDNLVIGCWVEIGVVDRKCKQRCVFRQRDIDDEVVAVLSAVFGSDSHENIVGTCL